MNYNTVIFDLDGTLLDTLDDLADSLDHTLTEVGAPTLTREQVRRYVGNGMARLIELALPGGRDDPRYDRTLETMQAYYKAHNQIKTAPYPGVLELVDELRRRGCALAVVSNKPDTSVKPLVKLYFGDSIPVAIGQRPDVRRKPAPDAVEEALRQLGRDRSEAVYVGDSEVDLYTARNAGMDCISVTWGFRDRELLDREGATRYADTPAEVLNWLE
ncbi:MAG: HAD family hydrolase [Clostridiales bacterium]|nr:HAD family hydrolase [Clostridiales bacterium]